MAMTEKIKIYISGPISGKPDYNRPAFDEAKRQLADAGYDPVSPLDCSDPEWSWEECMKADIRTLLECEGVAYLQGWTYSRGSVIEIMLAMDLEIPIKTCSEWLVIKKDVSAGQRL